jgi:hypothetical protein
MSGRYPEIVYTEDGMREGMQSEDANIPIDAKVALPPIATVSRRVYRPLRWMATGRGMRRSSPNRLQ